jgi:hypothetical protein
VTTTVLKPRSTVLFENDNKIRLRPNANAGELDATQYDGHQILAPNATTLEDANIVRTRNRPNPSALQAVAEQTGGADRPLLGIQLGNKTFPLEGGEDPNSPVFMAVVFVDADDSITGGGGDGIITFTYTDDTDTGRVDVWQLTIDGKGPHYTSFKVKSITSIVGTGFDAAGGGAPNAEDRLLVGPYVEDTVHDIVSPSGTPTGGPVIDPNKAGVTNGDAFFVGAEETTDTKCYVSFPDLTAEPYVMTGINNLQFYWWVKNVGATSNGCHLVFRINGDSDWVLETHTITGTETGGPTLVTSDVLTTNPKTSLPWTLAEYAGLEVGVIFKGDNPTIEKRWEFFRCHIGLRQGFVHPTIDGSVPANYALAYSVVAKDPFVTPTDDATQFLPFNAASSSSQMIFGFEDLPAEALTVDSLETFVRYTTRNVGEPQGAGLNDLPCGIGTPPRANTDSLNRLQGPTEQSNVGGCQVFFTSSASNGSRRVIGVGDPPSGCGNFNDFLGDDVGYGNFQEISHAPNGPGDDAWEVSEVNGLNAGIRGLEDELFFQISRVFTEVAYKRSPTGESFFHLVVDDDIDSPNDAEHMDSQHSANKKFGVDFSGIPETTKINSVVIKMRAKAGTGSSVGWRAVWRTNGSDFNETAQFNTDFETKTFTRTLNPITSAAWTRAEVNALVVIFESLGENAFVEKTVSVIGLEVDFEPIPEKIDNARDIASRKLRLYRKPVPFFKVKLPLQFLDPGILGDVQVAHRAIPRAADQIGFERWERSLFRVFREVLDLNEGEVELTLLDLRDFLVTLWVSGRTKIKGTSAEGMAVMTPGVELDFIRATNDYFEDPFAGFIQELASDEFPGGAEGILIQNGSRNRLINSHFSEGATDAFDNWTKVGLPATGASIVEDLEDLAFDQTFSEAPDRSVKMTGADTPADIYLEQRVVDLPSGSVSSPEGCGYAFTIEHKDDSAQPLSYSIIADPDFFGDAAYDVRDNSWFGTSRIWFTLPVRSNRTRDIIPASLMNMNQVSDSPDDGFVDVLFDVGVRTSANQINHVYGVTLEGGAIAAQLDQHYATTRILAKTGPVVRDPLQFRIENRRSKPAYPAELRGTFFCEAVPFWDSAKLPLYSGVRRYIYSLVTDADNWDLLYYDGDTEEFVFERRLVGTTKKATKFFPGIKDGQIIRLATRWISSEGELDETPFSFTIFVDDKQGSTQSFAEAPSLPTGGFFYLGSNEGTDGTCWDGVLREINITQFAETLARIKRLP